MEWRNDISVDVVNTITISEYGRKKGDQTPKYTILKNGVYCVHRDWDKKQKVREKVVMPCPLCGH